MRVQSLMQKYERTRAVHKAEQKKVAATAVKLPTFWIEDPKLWFAQVECVFNRQPKITEDATKYNYICKVLPSRAQRCSMSSSMRLQRLKNMYF